ncbi:hypothetical protein P3T73_13545 [Kiritimatiellota bacterium B12222]|nr:hypothetical protein P3T73_13545 [Kiritimatiellota bacterium B12222]
MNPLLPLTVFVPDVEAHVAPDGRLYLYGSIDVSGDTVSCSDQMHVYSSDDLQTWTDHGEVFHLDRSHSPHTQSLHAPDAFRLRGKSYLLYCGSGRLFDLRSFHFS